jgi:asparagine synthase (glutamine-hydrolysing)
VQTNGFALFRGESAAGRAERAAAGVARRRGRVMVDSERGFREFERGKTRGERIALAYSLEEGGRFPLVHGFADAPSKVEEGGLPDGEFAILAQRDGEFHAARDLLGTRGLYVGEGGSLASDGTLLSGVSTLLPPGTTWSEGLVRRLELRRIASPASFEEASQRLGVVLEESVGRRVAGRRKVAVSFSGGLDSSLLALLAARRTEVVLCSAYANGSRDEAQSSAAAEMLGLELVGRVIDREAAGALSKGMRLPFEPTSMDRALWAIYSTTAETASENGAEVILLGQLADELFGGYRKYAAEAAREPGLAARMMDEDVRGCAERGFIRDEAACAAWAEPRFPYADAEVASLAKALPLGYKINGEERKAVLRDAALRLGLPEGLASAPKKAAQYSSGVAKLLA